MKKKKKFGVKDAHVPSENTQKKHIKIWRKNYHRPSIFNKNVFYPSVVEIFFLVFSFLQKIPAFTKNIQSQINFINIEGTDHLLSLVLFIDFTSLI